MSAVATCGLCLQQEGLLALFCLCHASPATPLHLHPLQGERPLLRRIAALAAGQPGGARRAAELAAEVDAELAALGLLDASALMHGCRVAVLPLLLGAERELHLHGRSTTAADSQTAESAATDCPSLLAGASVIA